MFFRTSIIISIYIVFSNIFAQEKLFAGIIFSDSLYHAADSLFISSADSLFESDKVLPDTSKHSSIDSVITIWQKPFFRNSFFIRKSDILRNDYRYTGDLLKNFLYAFERSYGFIGQPNDIYLFGEKSALSNYLMDGLSLSYPLFYGMDFNQLQSEDIDSIEIIALPRSFLFGQSTNPVTVNFISKDILSQAPFSRIKYYEGPYGEAFIDGFFNIYILNDLIASLDVTNRKVDESFQNSSFSIWQVKSKLKYNISNAFNLIGSYYFSKSQTGINGGVDYNTILQSTSNVNSILFDETLAPVNYENNSLSFKQHNFNLKLISTPTECAYTNLDLYYKYYQTEYFVSDSNNNSKAEGRDKDWGIKLDQRISFQPIEFSLNSGYIRYKHKAAGETFSPNNFFVPFSSDFDYNSFFISPLISLPLLDSVITPAIYFKHTKVSYEDFAAHQKNKNSYTGFGADVSLSMFENINLYLGYSQFDDARWFNKIKTMEFRLSYKKDSNSLLLDFFNNKNSKTNFWGAGLNSSLILWKFLFETSYSQYFIQSQTSDESLNMPLSNLKAGIYYKDILFKANLDLKAGCVVKYAGKQKLKNFQNPYTGTINLDVDSWLTIDFSVTAEIQKSAIVYFTWENLFDKKYYITPYYPMLERSIRFGIAWEILN